MKKTLLLLALITLVSVSLFSGTWPNWRAISVDDLPSSFFGEWYNPGWNISAHEDHFRTGNVFFDYAAILQDVNDSSHYCLLLESDGRYIVKVIYIINRSTMDVAEASTDLEFSRHTKK